MQLRVLLFTLSLTCMAQVQIKQSADRLTVTIDGKPFTEFFVGAESTKPYLHPLRTASGKIVTRSYPMESVAGEAKDHPHHRGLWITHGLVNQIDFWANEKDQKGAGTAGKGTIITRRVTTVESGKKKGVIGANFEWQDAAGKGVLAEQRTMTFYPHPTERIVDFDVTWTALQDVVFGDTKEGMFAIRLATDLEEKHSGKMRTADGKEGEKQVWGKRSPWVDYAGTLAGEKVGLAILDHPTNPRHPTYWHSRAYGLFAANPFGVHDFENDKTKNGEMKLGKGGAVRFRYRLIIHPGDATDAKIAEEFAKYAKVK
jgi:hypothetical protein